MDAAATSQLVYCGMDSVRPSACRPMCSCYSSSPLIQLPRKSAMRSWRQKGVVLAVATEPTQADRSAKPAKASASSSLPKPVNGNGSTNTGNVSKKVNGVSNRMRDVSDDIKRVRAQMEENEQLSVLMRGLRGQNLKDEMFADDNIKLRLVEYAHHHISVRLKGLINTG